MPSFNMGSVCHPPFQQTLTLLRRSNGVLEEGLYYDGEAVASTFNGVVAVPKGGDIMNDLPPGRSVESYIRVSTIVELRTVEDPLETGHPPDLVFHRGRWHEVVKSKYVPFSEVHTGLCQRLVQEPDFHIAYFGKAGSGASVSTLAAMPQMGLAKRGAVFDITPTGSQKIYFAVPEGSLSDAPVLNIPTTVSTQTIGGAAYTVLESVSAGLGPTRVRVS